MTEIMKHFFTLMALLLTSVTFGQETCNNVFDYNDNNTIDIEDFLAILGLFADVDLDDDGTWDSLDNCLDLSACNYASELNEPCTYLPLGDCDCNGNVLDECGVCGGTGLAPGTCDCNGTLIDVIGVCGGDCWADEDADGICDDVDDCVGEYDACDVCNGPGAIYECGCANILEGECDCDGNVLDAIGVCGGVCSADEDADGVCDDVDDCVGEFDVCGVCNGPGEVYECGCGDVPEGECDCEGNVLDALGECGGDCLADEDGDGVCDDVDDCVGEFDECGVCNGDGAVYECGCNDIPEGECDCDGNVFDECGVCNGPGPTEIVIEDIVTYYDSVYLPFDDAWYVYPVDADTTFGFTCAPSFQGCGDPVSYHGYDYATVQIGDQCWFAENLRNECYQNGDSIPAELDDNEWYTTTSGAMTVIGEGNSDCYSSNCDQTFSLNEYGRLYNWYSVDDSRGICPNGWHVPTENEWTTLTTTLGGMDVAGLALKSEEGWGAGFNGTNSSGFSALPGGWRWHQGWYEMNGGFGFWWGSTMGNSNPTFRALGSSEEVFTGDEGYEDANNGMSLRCIQDTPTVLGCIDTDMDDVCDEDEVLGCTDETALNYDPAATEDAGNCVLPVGGCTDPTACNYDASANTNDGSCDFWSCFGCLIELACNYDAGATYPDASQCDFETCYGCMDPMACNYDDTASFDYGSCEYESCAPSFEACGDPVSYQGYDYATVQIGEQCWFAENLRSENYANGESVPNPNDVTIYGALDYPCYSDEANMQWDPCNDTTQTLNTYGRLYARSANLCPSGWNVPNDQDWMSLETSLGMSSEDLFNTGYQRGTDQGLQMKSPDGFGGLYAGYHGLSSEFAGAGGDGFWMSVDGFDRSISTSFSGVWRGDASAFLNKLSVRCVKAID